ncbi:MAG: magnesium-translocating P-type ATPase [Candidatus Paceibacterota bacterium]|jgi:Mg2+-importing ATPase|nr:magnesium-translocating P-type ATPase [Candidatus Paceibacterota bacterium]
MQPNTTKLPSGLSSKEAKRRLLEYGENVIYHKARLRPLVAFVKKFNSPLLLMLIATSIVSLFLGQKMSATVILAMVFLSAVMDFLNTRKSEAVAEKLVEKVASTVSVRRDGEIREVPLRLIVPGDIIELSAGNVIPADCRVLTADDLFVNQSSLTGESFPVEKYEDREKGTALLSKGEELPLGSDKAVFMGSSVVTGFATAVVLRTGGNAEFGRIAERLAKPDEETDFDRGIRNFSVFVMRLTLVMVTVVFFLNAIVKHNVFDSFLFSVAIAVGLTPELLPVIMSVSLARGSMVMSEKKVIVKNLSAIQNFGGMNILCTDKTGTLTQDRITLIECVDISGVESKEVFTQTYLSSVMHTAKRSAIDLAIEEHGKMDISEYKKIDEIPFDFHRRRDSVVIDRGSERTIICKGAPRNILEECFACRKDGKDAEFTKEMTAEANQQYNRLSGEGYRVLAIAEKRIPQEERSIYQKEEENSLIFLGFAAFLDPPKTSVAPTLVELEGLHIEVKVLTGDSEILTERICKEIGLPVKGVLHGEEIAELSDSELSAKVAEVNIFARVSPEQKERIVVLLRKQGNVVGYLGDGINDAPVLRAADVGISVNNAVDVAKETADIILLDKSLEVLKDGIIEGRKTFQNTMKYIKMGFSSNFGNMFSMMGASAFLPFLPMLPAQILLNNFMYDMSQTTLSTDSTDEEDTIHPLRWDTRFFGKYIAVFGLVSSIFDFITFFVLYKVFSLGASGFQTGWFIESIATQVLIIYIIRTKRVPFWKSWPSLPVICSTIGIVTLAWIIPFTPISTLLRFAPLSPFILVSIAGIVFTYLLFGELTKAMFYRAYKKAL